MSTRLRVYGDAHPVERDTTMHALPMGIEPETMPLVERDIRCSAVVERDVRCPYTSKLLRVARKQDVIASGIPGKYPVCGTHARPRTVILVSAARYGIGVPER
jgi:hypothetical protein